MTTVPEWVMLPECAEVIDAQIQIAAGDHASVDVVRMFALYEDFTEAAMPEWAIQAAGCAEVACMREIREFWP